jgi:hypothetical protein
LNYFFKFTYSSEITDSTGGALFGCHPLGWRVIGGGNAGLARQNGGPFGGSFAVDPIEQGVSALSLVLSLSLSGGGSTPPARQDACVVRGFWECHNILHLLSHSPLALSFLCFLLLGHFTIVSNIFLVSNLRFPICVV